MKTRSLCVLLAAACLLGCGESSHAPDDAIARIGGYAITEADLLLAAGSAELDETTRAAALAALADEARLAAAAREDGLLDDPAVQAEIVAAERQILARRYRSRVLEASVDGRALHEHFDARREALTIAEVRVRHLRVGLDPGLNRIDPDAARRAAMNRARTLYARLESGTSFSALASELGDDPQTTIYAEPVAIREGDVDAEFFERVRGLDRGAIAPPFATGFGAHVVQAERAAVMHRPKLPEVSGRLRAELRAEAERALMRRLDERYPLQKADSRTEEPVR